MTQPGRRFAQGIFNLNWVWEVKRKSIEINENSYTAEFWQYDSRIGRRFNIDPKPTTSISPYAAFENNPIWFGDPLGDSVVDPNRTRAITVMIVGKTRDKTSDMSAKRLEKTQEKNPANTIYIESDKLDKATAADIIKKLGADGYIGTLVLDFHRHDYDDNMPEKETFYAALADGYAGKPTQVLAGMCWSGGSGGKVNGTDRPDLTMGISKALDKATVYGLKTEAGNLPFRTSGNYGAMSPDVLFSGNMSKNERRYRSTWTISSYDTKLGAYDQKVIKQRVLLNWSGAIQIKKTVF